MKVKSHAVCTTLFSVPLYFYYGIGNTILFWVSAVFIDFDHYLYYVIKTGKFSLKHAVNYHMEILRDIENGPTGYRILLYFHTVEFLLFLLIASIFFNFVLFIFWGCVFHLVLDVLHSYIKGFQSVRQYSFIRYYFFNK